MIQEGQRVMYDGECWIVCENNKGLLELRTNHPIYGEGCVFVYEKDVRLVNEV